jgi:hypothetical protein
MKTYLDDETAASIQANSSLKDTFYGVTSTTTGDTISEPITVIQAMIQEDGEGKSYFDLYAPSYLKNEVQLYISGSGGNTSNNTQITTSGQYADLKANTLQTIDFSKDIDSGPEYYLIVAARHVNGLDYGFKAVGSINNPDDVPPAYKGDSPLMVHIDSFSVSGHTYDDLTELANMTTAQVNACKFTGSFSLVFTKPLYQITAENGVKVRKAVVAEDGHDTADTVSLLSICGGLVASHANSASGVPAETTNTYDIEFTDIQLGDKLVLFNEGEIGNATSVSTSKKLTLTFEPLLTNESYNDSAYIINEITNNNNETVPIYRPGFLVDWSD